MKKIIYFLVLISFSSFGQRRTDENTLSQGKSGVTSTTQLGNSPLSGNNDGLYNSNFWSTTTVEKKNNVKGSIYLFDNWLNKAEIYTNDNKGYKLSFVNFNIKRNKIDAKFDNNGKEQVFSFDTSSLLKVNINGKDFCKKLIEFKGRKINQLVEKLNVRGKIRLYKFYSLFIRKGNFNPMTQAMTSPNKYVKRVTYYIEKDNGKIEEIKLKKSIVIKHIGEEISNLKQYIKKNKLKMKNEKDFIDLLNYYNSL